MGSAPCSCRTGVASGTWHQGRPCSQGGAAGTQSPANPKASTSGNSCPHPQSEHLDNGQHRLTTLEPTWESVHSPPISLGLSASCPLQQGRRPAPAPVRAQRRAEMTLTTKRSILGQAVRTSLRVSPAGSPVSVPASAWALGGVLPAPPPPACVSAVLTHSTQRPEASCGGRTSEPAWNLQLDAWRAEASTPLPTTCRLLLSYPADPGTNPFLSTLCPALERNQIHVGWWVGGVL